MVTEADLKLSTKWEVQPLTFTCPTDDSLKLRVESTLDAGDILLDNATIGRSNFFQIGQNLQDTIFGQRPFEW